MGIEATGAPQKHHHTLNQQVGSITAFLFLKNKINAMIIYLLEMNVHNAYYV